MTFDPSAHYQDLDVAEHYDVERFSSVSGRAFQYAERLALGRLLSRLPEGGRVLDAPCGTGRLVELLVARRFHVTGIDVSHEMLTVSRRRHLHLDGALTLSRADLTALPFADRSFDLAMSMRFFPHFGESDRRPMLRELARVSRRWVLISVSLSTGWHRARRALKRALRHQVPTRFPVTTRAIAADLASADLAVVWSASTLPVVSEELLMLCERRQGRKARG